MRSWSIRARLTLLATLAMALVCAVSCAAITMVNHRQAVIFQTSQIEGQALQVVRLIRTGDLPKNLPTSGLGSTSVQVVDGRGAVVSGTGDLSDRDRLSGVVPPSDRVTSKGTWCDLPDAPGCVRMVIVRVHRPDGDWFVYAFDRALPWYVGPRFIGWLVAGTLPVLLLTALGTSVVVRRALSPVGRIRREASEIGRSVAAGRSLGRRVPLPEHQDELQELAVTINTMLERLEASMLRQRQFASDTSHDLRTPVTGMRAELEEAMLHPDDVDCPALIARLHISVERLHRLVEDLLALSRLEYGGPAELQSLDLADLVLTEVARREPDARLRLNTEPVTVRGSALQLTRLLGNLLDNAERHAARRIDVRVRQEGDEAVLEVENDGDTIPAEACETVFERFTRLDASRTKDTGGSGLGLAIVREIAHAHHGAATAAPTPEGTLLQVRLPAAR
ncbi:hypothetical protein GCM10022221_66290 [Actinocorallia aurea]